MTGDDHHPDDDDHRHHDDHRHDHSGGDHSGRDRPGGARATPTVSAPVTWEEVEAARSPADLTFTADDVLSRVEEHGDLFDPLLRAPGS